MKDIYLELILRIERLHRRFLDVIKAELDRQKIDDVNNVQTLILYNIGDEQLTVGELTNRGYYLGSNVSYNVKKLVESGYLIQEQAPHDKRSTRVRLSDKGLDICAKIDNLYESHVEKLKEKDMGEDVLESNNKMLLRLERFWSDQIGTGFGSW